jgi:hypothetical protein
MKTLMRAVVPVMAVGLLLASCAATDAASPGAATATATSTPSPSPTVVASPLATPSEPNPALRAELVEMLAQDQADRFSSAGPGGDIARTERLKEIIAAYGWPTISMVGEDGEDAAWAIAQHSDLDTEFQREALELLRAAVAAGDGSPGNLAYLEDRVAAGAGQPQTYGTQVGCGEDGPVPGTPIKDEANVDERRADAGLPPLADYYAEMAAICAQDG